FPDKFLRTYCQQSFPYLAPTVETREATVSGTGATITGTVNPNALASNVWFEWGTSSDLATFNTTPLQLVASGAAAVPISVALSTLTAGTTYYYRAVASNSGGTTKGMILSFTVAPGRPDLTTSANVASSYTS